MIDIVLLRTFLELNRTRHFGKAAENLYITQSTMSARIRQLEEILGAILFIRQRNNIQLTPAGQKLIRHAEGILAAWEHTRMDVALPDEQKEFLSIGGMFSLWDIFLQEWLHEVHKRLPEIGLRTDAMKADEIHRALLENRVDVGFVFEAAHYDELTIRELPTIELHLVASEAGLNAEQALNGDYILVDWGISFSIQHTKAYPDAPAPALHMSMGRNALACLLECGGSAYLAKGMVEDLLNAKRLFRVEDAAIIKRPCYALYRTGSEKNELIEQTINLIR
jgi:DNA-binding transcriptional LysR family regulator